MSTDKHGHETLDSYFTDGHVEHTSHDINDLNLIDDVEQHHNPDDIENLPEDESEKPKKSIFKKWYFWFGSICLFITLVCGLYVQQMMSGSNMAQRNNYPVVIAPEPVHSPTELTDQIVPTNARSALEATSSSTTSVSTGNSGSSVVLVSTEVDLNSKLKKIDLNKSDSVEKFKRVEDLEKQVNLLMGQLDEERNAKQAALAKMALMIKSEANTMANTKSTLNIVGSHKKVAKKNLQLGSKLDAINDTAYFANYHIDAIVPGQARVTNGGASEYVTIGSVINGAKVLKIDATTEEILTSHGVIH